MDLSSGYVTIDEQVINEVTEPIEQVDYSYNNRLRKTKGFPYTVVFTDLDRVA